MLVLLSIFNYSYPIFNLFFVIIIDLAMIAVLIFGQKEPKEKGLGWVATIFMVLFTAIMIFE